MIKQKISVLNSGVSSFLKKRLFKKLAWVPVIAFTATLIGSNLVPISASAVGLVSSRSITMSSSVAGPTGIATYFVSFKPFTTGAPGNLGAIDVDFCSNDPIIGDPCTAPPTFSMLSSTVTTPTGFSTSTGSWGATFNGAKNLVWETNATAQTVTGSATAITFSINTVVNPSTVGSFYARILTFDTQAHGTAYTSGSTPGAGLIDAGGIALSVVQQITINAKVQEQITFCVYTASYDGGGGACSGATGNTITLGNTNGVLFSSTPFVDIQTKYDIQTNASLGASIVFTGPPPTIPSTTNTIAYNTVDGMGVTAGSAYTSVIGNTSSHSQFGLCTWASFGATTNITPVAPYTGGGNCSTTSQTAGTGGGGGVGTATFGFDTANAANTTTNPYGSQIATATAGSVAAGEIAFVGNVAPTAVAGVYTTNLTFIATGTY